MGSEQGTIPDSEIDTLSLENHQDGVYLHRHGVTLSLQAILVCSNLPVFYQAMSLCNYMKVVWL